MDWIVTIITSILGLFGGGVILHLYQEWRGKRNDDQSHRRENRRDNIDEYRWLLEDERASRKKVEEIIESLKRDKIDLLTENIALKSKREGQK